MLWMHVSGSAMEKKWNKIHRAWACKTGLEMQCNNNALAFFLSLPENPLFTEGPQTNYIVEGNRLDKTVIYYDDHFGKQILQIALTYFSPRWIFPSKPCCQQLFVWNLTPGLLSPPLMASKERRKERRLFAPTNCWRQRQTMNAIVNKGWKAEKKTFWEGEWRMMAKRDFIKHTIKKVLSGY